MQLIAQTSLLPKVFRRYYYSGELRPENDRYTANWITTMDNTTFCRPLSSAEFRALADRYFGCVTTQFPGACPVTPLDWINAICTFAESLDADDLNTFTAPLDAADENGF